MKINLEVLAKYACTLSAPIGALGSAAVNNSSYLIIGTYSSIFSGAYYIYSLMKD